MRTPPNIRTLLPAIAVILAACSDESATGFDTVLHLDLQLANGSSPAAALSSEHMVVARVRLEPGDETRGDWRVERLPAGSGEGDSLRITHNERIPARRVHAIEVDVRSSDELTGRVSWRTGNESHALVAENRTMSEGAVLSFDVGRSAGWNGDIQRLVLDLEGPLEGDVELGELRLLALGLPPGYEPLGSSEDAANPGDWGLVPIHGLALRAWPAAVDVALFAGARVPDGALLTVSVAALGALPDVGAGGLHCTVDLRSGEGAWERVAGADVSAGDDWRALRADLSAFAGEEVELRFSAVRAGGEPARARARNDLHAVWGEPLVLGCTDRGARPSVLLITLDTLRADHALDASETPVLRGLAEHGIEFTNAWSVCNSTMPSHASILTGLFVPEHGVFANNGLLTSEVTTLAERLRSRGYQTGAVVSVTHLEAGTGFGQGFDRFQQASAKSYFDGRVSVDALSTWVDEWHAQGARPFFLWLHLFDPHTPYGPPGDALDEYLARNAPGIPERWSEPPSLPVFEEERPPDLRWLGDITNIDYVSLLYRASTAFTDRLVGRVLQDLEVGGMRSNTIVVLTSDHGESLGEHGVYCSHQGLHEETLRVPLLLQVPGGPAGVCIREPVQTIDIAPTLLGLTGLAPDPLHAGVDLLDLARRGQGDPRRRVWFHHAQGKQVGVRTEGRHFVSTLSTHRSGFEPRAVDGDTLRWKWTVSARGENQLWELSQDPHCTADGRAADAETVARMLEELEAWSAGLVERRAFTRALNDEEEQRLRALGYLGE